jgi:hypothetical protein
MGNNITKNKMPVKKQLGVIDFECLHCSKRISLNADKGSSHPLGWKSVTKESDHSLEKFYLCPECYSRYKSGLPHKVL